MANASLFHEVHATDLHSRLRNPEASLLLACWVLARGAADLPSEPDFLKHVIEPSRQSLMILRRIDGDDWLYEHYGSLIAAHAGFDMTGEKLSAFKGSLGAFFRSTYERCATERRPLVTLHRYGFFKERPLWERLILPIADGNGVTALYVINRVRELDHEVTMMKSTARGSGMIALQFRRDETGAVTEALIIGANRAALTMTGRRLDQLMDRSMGECFPGIFETGLWDRYQTVSRTRQPQSFILDYGHDAVAGSFTVTITPFHDGVTIEFNPSQASGAGEASVGQAWKAA